MKKVSLPVSWLAVLVLTAPVLAHDPVLKIVVPPKPAAVAAASPAASETPSYQQPCVGSKELVWQMAEYRATARLQRLNSMKWFGMSNTRPYKSSDPYHSDASPTWVSNSLLPYRWQASAAPIVVIR